MPEGQLWTSLITPATLTGYARASQEDLERQWGSLSRYFPNEFVPDIVAQFEVGGAGLLPVAPFRSYDAEVPLGKTQGRQKVFIELPPIGLKNRISERDQLRQRDGNTQGDVVVTNSLLKLTDNIVNAVTNRLEVARGQALETGGLDIAENGFIQAFDFERDPSMEVSATDGGGDFWDDPDAAVIEQLIGWVEDYERINNVRPGSILFTSRRQVAALARNKEFRALYATLVGQPSRINRAAVNAVLEDNEIPPIDIYERKAQFDNGDGDGVITRPILSPNKVFLLPPAGAGVDQGGLGATYWGQTLEADEPEYGLEGDELPGIVAGVWKTRDPIGLWVHCSAIAMPVAGDANRSMVATVLPEAS